MHAHLPRQVPHQLHLRPLNPSHHQLHNRHSHDGVEATRLILEQLPAIKVIMLTVSEADDLDEIKTGATKRSSLPAPQGPTVTRRELEILRLVAEGLSDKKVGKRLSITEGTVKNHVHNALEKLHMENRIQATAYIVRQGLGRRPVDE